MNIKKGLGCWWSGNGYGVKAVLTGLKPAPECFYRGSCFYNSLFIALFLLFAASAAHAAQAVGKFSAVEGRVEVMRDGRLPAVIARVGVPVFAGDIIKTKSDSKAEIIFRDNTVLHLAPRNELKIDEYLRNAQKQERKAVARVMEMKGIAAAAFAGSASRLLTPGAVIYEHDGIATGAGSYAVIVFADGARVTLSENSRFAVNRFDYNPASPQKGKAYLSLLAGNAEVRTGRLAEVNPDSFLFKSAIGVIRAHGAGSKEGTYE